ncbi:MAG TPA: preprotein translocase subunit SecG [Synergistaceae bacterium]|nr:preprotein translocase subunit SecG [Synergistaceae bacterium]NLL40469.1 preprotein translocase subunit SecG [Synergistaceae bacterium]HPX03542.1 preprotein translocase subunit SecG [Synergistaceae bacterium]HQA54531.1 preprotein translocase subunit SecG [Synergistaceae bacterium]
MKILIGILHILVCVALIGVIMMQHRKSGGFTGSFGGGGTQADMGGTWQRMSSLTKVTAGLMVAFMVLSILQVVIR